VPGTNNTSGWISNVYIKGDAIIKGIPICSESKATTLISVVDEKEDKELIIDKNYVSEHDIAYWVKYKNCDAAESCEECIKYHNLDILDIGDRS
jgi:hypothetical protein